MLYDFATNKNLFYYLLASNIKEISHALNEIWNITSSKVCLMHCILSYPTEYVDANLEMILGLKEEFNDVVLGYSDHTVPDNGMLILTLAYLKGAAY